jgi:autoinducer-2 kinase
MAHKYLMAVDAGTGSVRAVIFDQEGVQLGCTQKEWKHLEDSRYPGSMNFDWDHNWKLVRTCISEVLSTAGISSSDIAAVSTTCMREGIILYNKEGKEIWACANVDARSNKEVEQLKAMAPSLEKELYCETGQTYALSAIPRILWVKNNLPSVYKDTAFLGMFNDWLIYKMSGKLAVEPSNGSTSGLFSLKNRTWDKTIAERCNLRSDIFPPVQECGNITATVNGKGAKDTGLAEGTPLIVGGGDAQLGTIGVGATESNEAAVFGGTFWQYEYNTDNCNLSEQCGIRLNCHVQPDLWQYEALAFKPGLVMRWYRDAFCQEEVKEAQKTHTSAYALMDKKAAMISAGSYGIQCTFSDIMNFTNWRHAAPTFTNFDLEAATFNKYSFYRAILENTAYVTYGHIQLVKNATGKVPQSITFAGGAAQSNLWAQILADVIGLPVRVPIVKEATALGAAIMAAKGIGIYPTITAAAKAMVKIEKTYQPVNRIHSEYLNLYQKWQEIYAVQLKLSDTGITRHMWIAPGLQSKQI